MAIYHFSIISLSTIEIFLGNFDDRGFIQVYSKYYNNIVIIIIIN